MEMGDIHAVGLMSLLKPLVAYKALKARKERIDERLIKKYFTEEYFFTGSLMQSQLLSVMNI